MMKPVVICQIKDTKRGSRVKVHQLANVLWSQRLTSVLMQPSLFLYIIIIICITYSLAN